MVAEVQKENGVWTLEDLKKYQIKIRKPIKEDFKDFSIVTLGEPSAGGYSMIAMLHGLEGYPNWKNLNQVDQTHFFAELMRRANMERKYYTDPAFEDQALPSLATDRFYPGKPLAIDMQKATASKSLTEPVLEPAQSEHTTFFVVVDKQGNRAAVNLTLNDMFGSGVMVPGVGIMLKQ